MAASKTTAKRRTPSGGRKKTGKAAPRKKTKKTDNYAAAVLISILAAIVLAIFIYFDSAGVAGSAIRNVVFGMFSSVSYLLPPVLLALGIYTAKRASTK